MDIIFDIDGTLFNVEHRVHFVKEPEYDQEKFEAEIKNDSQIPEMVDLLLILAEKKYNRIIFCTGRREKTRKDTQLQINSLTNDLLVKRPCLKFPIYMRKNNDLRPDSEVQSDLYRQMIKDGFNPKLVFEDRESVVKMWREKGLRCLQCAPGNF